MSQISIKTNHLNFAGQLQAFSKFKNAYPRYVGNMAVNFYKDSFKRQGYIESTSIKRWDKRKNNTKGKGRAILVKTGRLRRSIRIIRSGLGFVVVGSDVPYARIHNEGGWIKTTQNIGSFTRKAHKRKKHSRTWKGAKQNIKASQVIQSNISAHSRKVNTEIPQRQFMGASPFLIRRIMMNTEYKLKQILSIR
jgi:phage gpG-like protein